MTLATRGHRGSDHLLITQDNRDRSWLAYLPDAVVFKLVSPRLSPARFAQTLLQIRRWPRMSEPWPTDRQHFVYAIEGETDWELGDDLTTIYPGGFLYAPPGTLLRLADARDAQILHVACKRAAGDRPAPPARRGSRNDEPAERTSVRGLSRQHLLPVDDPAFDFAISIMTFDAAVGLDRVEIHDEEHGLYMLAGSGRYLLGDGWLDVETDDFIYVAPYCPQSFIAGAVGAEYLLYKDAWREAL